MQTHIPRARQDHLCPLVAVLQRPRRRTTPRSTYQDEKPLSWVWSRQPKRRSLTHWCIAPVPTSRHRPTLQRTQPRGFQNGVIRHAKRCSRRRAKSRLRKVSRSWSHTHLITPIQHNARLCQKFVGYDANCLYLSTMAKHMPCGPRVVRQYDNPQGDAQTLVQNLVQTNGQTTDKWFGYAEVDIRVSLPISTISSRRCAHYSTIKVDEADVPQGILDYLTRISRKRVNTKEMLGILSAKEILLFPSLLQCYIEHSLKVTALYRTIDYQSKKYL